MRNKEIFKIIGIKPHPAFKTREDYLAWVKDWRETIIKKQKEYKKNGYHN
jgi:hypothetical protein